MKILVPLLPRFIFYLCFLSFAIQANGQDIVEADTSQNAVFLKNDIGIGGSLTIPVGFYRQHLKGIYPGISLSYYRNIKSSNQFNQYVGAELNWVDLQSKRAELNYLNDNGELMDYTNWADAEMLSLTILYRLQPDLNFWLWPYLDAGAGITWFYTLERDRFPGVNGDDDEVEVDLLDGRFTSTFKFGAGLQYYINGLDGYLDLSWRYVFNSLVRYDVIEDRPLDQNEIPVDLLSQKRSNATSMQIKLTLNFIF